jgi:hypothetical protein
MNTGFQRSFFAGTSRLTDIAPVMGARLLDSTIAPLYGSRLLSSMFERQNRRIMSGIGSFRKFLIVPDIHIGDTVMTQSALIALRDFFPDAEIDYAVNRATAPLIEGNPDATRLIPVYSGGILPSRADLRTLRGIIREGDYDLVILTCPFIERRDIADRRQPVVRFMSHAPTLLRNERDAAVVNHFNYQIYRFIRGLLSMVARPVREDVFRGVRTTYSDGTIAEAGQFMNEVTPRPEGPVIMFNPDSASKFNLMPFEHQAALLAQLGRGATDDLTILLGAGHTEEGIGDRLAATLPFTVRPKVHIIPRTMPLEVYAALIDFADVFISGDTGPLHIAASRRYSRSGRHRFRNRTAVMSFFGATTPRMSGYDSHQRGYLGANQDAPSWCYQASSPCRNVTCLNKIFKTCRVLRCFEDVDVSGIASTINSHLSLYISRR